MKHVEKFLEEHSIADNPDMLDITADRLKEDHYYFYWNFGGYYVPKELKGLDFINQVVYEIIL